MEIIRTTSVGYHFAGARYQDIAGGEVVMKEGSWGLRMKIEERFSNSQGDLNSLKRQEISAFSVEQVIKTAFLHQFANLLPYSSGIAL